MRDRDRELSLTHRLAWQEQVYEFIRGSSYRWISRIPGCWRMCPYTVHRSNLAHLFPSGLHLSPQKPYCKNLAIRPGLVESVQVRVSQLGS